jgi:hypothetical protein
VVGMSPTSLFAFSLVFSSMLRSFLMSGQMARANLCLFPLLLGLPLHCRRGRVLELEQVPRAAADIRRAQALRHDALAAEVAGMAKDDIAARTHLAPFATGPSAGQYISNRTVRAG